MGERVIVQLSREQMESRIRDALLTAGFHAATAGQQGTDAAAAWSAALDAAVQRLADHHEALSQLYAGAFLACGTAGPDGTTWPNERLAEAAAAARKLLGAVA